MERTTWNMDCGANVSFEITPELQDKLLAHPQVVEHLIRIGLKNVVQDSHASVVRKDFESDEAWIAAKREKAGLKLGKLLEGELSAQSNERNPRVDEFTTYARRAVLSALGAEKRKELAATEDKGAAYLDAVFAKNEAKLRPIAESLQEAARKAAEEKAKLGALDLDI